MDRDSRRYLRAADIELVIAPSGGPDRPARPASALWPGEAAERVRELEDDPELFSARMSWGPLRDRLGLDNSMAGLVSLIWSGEVYVFGASAALGPSPLRPPAPRPASSHPAPAPARAVHASLTVLVVDGKGLPLPTTRVRVDGPAGTLVAQTDDLGVVVFDPMPAGHCTVRATRQAYRAASSVVSVPAGGKAAVELTLRWLVAIFANNVEVVGAQRRAVGERVTLELRAFEGATVVEPRWTLPGSVASAQTMFLVEDSPGQSFATRARTDALAEDALRQREVVVHWLTAQRREVAVSGVVEGAPFTLTAQFDVAAPKVVKVTPQTRAVEIGPDQNGDLALVLGHLGTKQDERRQGFRLDLVQSPPDFIEGELAFVQLIRPFRGRVTANGQVGLIASKGEFWLDDRPSNFGGMFQGTPTTTFADETPHAVGYEDAPNQPLAVDDVFSGASDSFRTSVMWRPKSAGSIWVTIQTVDWSWQASARRDDAGAPWQLLPGASASAGGGVATTEPPEWTDAFTRHKPEFEPSGAA